MVNLFLLFLLVFNLTTNFNIKSKTTSEDISSVSQWSQVSETSPSGSSSSPFQDEDTLVLDDGNAVDYSGDKYVAQRFSPGVLCSLKSFIWRTSMEYTECSLFVWSDSSGIPQSSNNLVPPFYFYNAFPAEWERMYLSLPLVIDKDFWIGICNLGAASSFFYDWTPNCHKRVAESPDKIDWRVYDYHMFGEFLIRPIVKLTGPRHDVSCIDLFSKRGFFLPNPSFDTVGVVVKNFGNVTEKDIPVYLRVIDSLGMLVFFDVQYMDSLKHNEIDTVF
ncbi:hypothetical protein KAU34_08930, partial [candidate division WOR-3 bacterium]|nr:hypothetical protein [candidate division WOR-3 bacterium]